MVDRSGLDVEPHIRPSTQGASQIEKISRLTLPQKEVLRYVARGMSSDEISLELGISVDSVNDRIERARRTLGGIRRTKAARLLVEAEEAALPSCLGSSPRPFGGDQSPFSDDRMRAANPGGQIREERSSFSGLPSRAWSTPFADRPIFRVLVMVNLTILLILGLVLLKPMSEGFRWLARTVEPLFEYRG